MAEETPKDNHEEESETIPPEEAEDLTHGFKWAGGAFGHIVNNLANAVVLSEDVPRLAAEGIGKKERELLKRFVALPRYIKLKLLKDEAKSVAQKIGTPIDSMDMVEELLRRFERIASEDKEEGLK